MAPVNEIKSLVLKVKEAMISIQPLEHNIGEMTDIHQKKKDQELIQKQ